MKKILFTITVILLVAVFGFSACMVGNYVLEGKQQAERNEELANIMAQAQTKPSTEATLPPETTEAPTEGTTVPTEPTEPVMLEGLKELYEMNPDVVGWLRIDETELNYPVLQTPGDPNYYLYRDFDGNNSKRGSVYAWSEADILEPSDNITLFGHNMADGSMFAALNAYINKDAWDYNPMIFFSNLYEEHTYKIISVFKTSANIGEGFSYHKFVDAQTEEEFNEFVQTCKDLAFYETGETAVYGDKLICLSTCEYTLDNGRLVVVAKRIA